MFDTDKSKIVLVYRQYNIMQHGQRDEWKITMQSGEGVEASSQSSRVSLFLLLVRLSLVSIPGCFGIER